MSSLRDGLVAAFSGRKPLPPICQTLGMKLTGLTGGTARLEMNVGKKYYNPMGTVHGGIMTDLADACMGLAVISTLEGAESFTTLELKMNFLRPVLGGKLLATGRVIHRGRSIALAESTLTDAKRKLVAKGSSTCMILKKSQSRARSATNAKRE